MLLFLFVGVRDQSFSLFKKEIINFTFKTLFFVLSFFRYSFICFCVLVLSWWVLLIVYYDFKIDIFLLYLSYFTDCFQYDFWT